jgi:hypothetical protein
MKTGEVASRTPLVGRDEQLKALSAAVDALSSGGGALVLIAGEPGIGKTRLAEAAAAAATNAGVLVAWGRAWEGGGAPPYWPWIQVLRSLERAMVNVADAAAVHARLAPDASDRARTLSATDRFLLFDTVAQYLLSVAMDRPALVVLEDLHATDESSLSFLSFLAKQLDDEPLLIVGTYRDKDAGAVLTRIARDAQIIAPARLTLEDITRLVAHNRSLANDAEALAVLHRVSEGNPLFVEEFLRLASTEVRSGSIPVGVRAAIRDHLGRLPADLQSLLAVASVFGREFTAAALAGVSSRPMVEVRELLSTGVDRGVLVERDGERYTFGHGLFGDTLHKDLSATRRSELHLAIADALEHVKTDDSSSNAEIAHHLFQAGPENADRALDALDAAIDDALRRLAFEVAIDHAKKALAVVPTNDSVRRFALLRRLAEAYLLNGELELGKGRCVDAATLARSLGDSDRLAEIALTYGLAFTPAVTDLGLVQLLEEALAVIGEAESSLRARLLARLAGALTPSIDSSRPLSLARAAVRMTEQADERARLDVLYAAGAALTPFAPPKERRRLNEEAFRLAARMEQPLIELRSHQRLVFDHLEAGDVTGSQWHARAHERLAATLPLPAWQPVMFRAMFALLEGRTADHEAAMAEIEDWKREPALELALLGHRLASARMRADEDGIRRDRSLLLECAARNPPPYGTMISAMLYSRLGEYDAARATLERTSPTEIVRHENPGMGLYGAEIAWRLGELSWAAPLYDWLVPHSGRMCVLGSAGFACDGSVDHALSLLALMLGRTEEARDHHRHAVARLRAMNARPLEARVSLEWAAEDASEPRSPIGLNTVRSSAGPQRVEMKREGEVWLVQGLGVTCRMRTTRGMGYLARLVEMPGRDLHVLDLAAEGGVIDAGDAGESLDPQAREAYCTRSADLRAEIDQAEQWNDHGKLERAREELAALEAELHRGLGLSGRVRREKQAAERARVAVKRRIDDAIRRIIEAEKVLGYHLHVAVRTGMRCSYWPERGLGR